MLAALVGAAILLILVMGLDVQVRTDMTDFLPRGRSPAARLVLDDAREGSSTGLILIAIEGSPQAELVRLSQTLQQTLPQTGLFANVMGGDSAMPDDLDAALFARRYLLSPASAPAAFTESALRANLQGLLRNLATSMAPLAAQFGFSDPPGVFLAMLRGWQGSSPVRLIDGTWFAADRDRTLLLLRTKAGGMDIPAQDAAVSAIRQAFQAANPGAAHLLLSGPAVFARDAASSIRSDVQRISFISTALIALLLFWRFRSLLVIAAIAAPVLLSIAVAATAVQFGFGSVQGAALGFGITMLGISLDYPVLMIGHRKAGEPAMATRARIGRAFVLAVITASLGLAAMTFSGFPGLAQLGVFSVVGLITAALATWFLLPRLVIAAELAPVYAGNPGWLPRIESWRRWRLLGLVPVLAGALYLALHGGPDWQGDLQALSPVPEASRALDAELRGELGAPEAGQIVLVEAHDREQLLQRQEALAPILEHLRTQGTIADFQDAARLLPSAATQIARRDALPTREDLQVRLAQAAAGLPFRAGAFTPFLDAVQASREMNPLLPQALATTPLGTRLEPLLFLRAGTWYGPVALQGVRDATALRTALHGQEGATYLDMHQELGQILSAYTAQAWTWLGVSALAVLAVLSFGLRDVTRVVRVLGAVASAMLCTVALLTVFGARLSLINLVALQLVGGVGLDYALFFARRLLDSEERARTLRTLVTCNAMTLLTFGLLAASHTPVLRDIGATVAIGAVLAMGFAFLFAGERQ